jgi:antitoxin HicB
MDQTQVKDLDYYLSRRYRIVLTPEEEGWSATVPDLPGCIAAGDTEAETLEQIEDARRSWLEASLQHGLSIPEPGDYSDDPT